MKRLQICILFLAISLCGIQLSAQQDSINIESKTVVADTDSLKNMVKGHRNAGNLFIGVDLFSPVISAFSDRQGGMAFASYRIYKKWNLAAEIGYEKNNFDDLDWKVNVDGVYFKFGFNWFASQDHQDGSNGFYAGARFGYAAYSQEIDQYPIRESSNQVDEYGSLPKENVSAYWFEMVGGGRVRLISSLYADVSVRPQIYLGSKKQQSIDPLVIPGYGKDRGPMNFSVVWGLSWKLF